MSHISHFNDLTRREKEVARRRSSRGPRPRITRARAKELGQEGGTGAVEITATEQQSAVAQSNGQKKIASAVTPRKAAGRQKKKASVMDYGGQTPAVGGAAVQAKTPASRFFSRHQPYSRRIAFQADMEAANEAEDNVDRVLQLCGRSWQVYRVSPLFGLKYEAEFLRAWEAVLARDVAAAKEADGECGSYLQGSRAVSVDICLVPGLRAAGTDAQALRMRVTCPRGRTLLAQAFLLATDVREELDLGTREGNDGDDAAEDRPPQGATLLPVLLLWGARALAKAVVDNLQRCFDCVVGRLAFREDDLRWAAAMWVGLHGGREQERDPAERQDEQGKMVKITYLMPPVTRGLVELELRQHQVSKLWKSIHDPTESMATVDEVEVFHAALSSHLVSSVGLRVAALAIKRIDMPIIKMESSGKIQIESSEHAKTVLRFLTSICQLHLESVTPRIGITSGDNLLM